MAAPDPGLEAYDPGLAPEAFGLCNTGAICHLNALLQALAGCTSVLRAALGSRARLGATPTGRAFYDYAWAAAPAAARPEGARPYGEGGDRAGASARVLAALVQDLRARRPGFRYGPGQESASEGLVLLLDMLEAPGRENPVARLFYHRYDARVYCRGCRAGVSRELDVAVQFNLFHLDGRPAPPRTPAEFGEALCAHASALEGYRCEQCGGRAGGYRHYELRMVPEVLVCLFNLYGRDRAARYFPPRFPIPGCGGTRLVFRQVAQVEHVGGLGGGHYTARGLRAGGAVCAFNDAAVAASAFGPSPDVYMVFYHFERVDVPATPA